MAKKSYRVDKLSIFNKQKIDKVNNNEANVAKENEDYFDPINVNTYCHMMLKRGMMIDVTILNSIVPCFKLRHKNKFIKLFYSRKEDNYLQPYFVFFDEFFFYFIKNLEPESIPKNDERRKYIRVIGKQNNIKKIDKIKVSDYEENDEEMIKVNITFKFHEINKEFEDENYSVKDIYFTLGNADMFFKMLKYFLSKYNIPINIPESYYNNVVDNNEDNNMDNNTKDQISNEAKKEITNNSNDDDNNEEIMDEDKGFKEDIGSNEEVRIDNNDY